MKNVSNSFILIYEDDNTRKVDINKKNFINYTLVSMIDNHLDSAPSVIDKTENNIDRLALLSGVKPKKVNVGNALGRDEMFLNSIKLDDLSKYIDKLDKIKEIVEEDSYNKVSILNEVLYNILDRFVMNIRDVGMLDWAVKSNIKSIIPPTIAFGLSTDIKDELEEELNKINKTIAKIKLYYSFLINSTDLEKGDADEYLFDNPSTKKKKHLFQYTKDRIRQSDAKEKTTNDYKEILNTIVAELEEEVKNGDYKEKDALEEKIKEADEVKCVNILLSSEDKEDSNYDLILNVEDNYNLRENKTILEEFDKTKKSKIFMYIVHNFKILYLNQSDSDINNMPESFDNIRKIISKVPSFDDFIDEIDKNIESYLIDQNEAETKIPKNIENFQNISILL